MSNKFKAAIYKFYEIVDIEERSFSCKLYKAKVKSKTTLNLITHIEQTNEHESVLSDYNKLTSLEFSTPSKKASKNLFSSSFKKSLILLLFLYFVS